MKICIFGAGAIGGHVAARLVAAKKDDICVVARGSALQAIRSRGLTLRSAGETIQAKPELVTDDASALPPQDLVIVALKAPALPAVAEALGELIKPQGCALFLVNGIPWWWRHGLPAPGGPLTLVDPDGRLWKHVKPERGLGGVVYSSNELESPGVINHTANDKWLIGEPDGSSSARLLAVVLALRHAGIGAEATPDVHREIWRKIVITSAGNSLSALTRLDFYELGAHPETRALMMSVMRETLAVAAALGYDLRGETDLERLAKRAKSRAQQRPHSMLWDVLTNRPLEVEALLGQTQAFAREHRVSVPTIDVILALLRGLDRAERYCGFTEGVVASR